jgi:broad specificity phosphatase PhoE
MPIIYLVRHGETDFNVEQRLQGRFQTRLNARGRGQAAFCGRLLGDLFARDDCRAADFDYVASPLQRARETMEIIRATLNLAPDDYGVDDRLMEIAYGTWEGLTLKEVEARDPEVLAQRERDKWDFKPSGGESYREVAARVASWYASVKRDTVAVAHGGVVRVLMANFRILPEEEATHAEVSHAVVYVFANGTMARYA